MQRIDTEYTDTPTDGASDNVPAVIHAAGRTLVPQVPFDVLEAFEPALGELTFVPTGEVSVGKPDRDEYYRAHPDPSLARTLLILRDRVCNEWYLVTPQVAAEIPDEVKRHTLYPLMGWHGDMLLWPVVAPAANGWLDPWNRSAHAHIERLRGTWGRIKGSDKGYRIEMPVSPFPEPVWPENLNPQDLIKRAFGNAYIDSLNHRIVRRLMGRIA